MLLLTTDFKKATFVPPHKPWLRGAVHKGHLLTAPRSRKGRIPCAIWKRGSVIPTCQYDFSMSFFIWVLTPHAVYRAVRLRPGDFTRNWCRGRTFGGGRRGEQRGAELKWTENRKCSCNHCAQEVKMLCVCFFVRVCWTVKQVNKWVRK